jgi:hypothetical protein
MAVSTNRIHLLPHSASHQLPRLSTVREMVFWELSFANSVVM